MNFTKEELKRFAADYELFEERCYHVLEILYKFHYKCERYKYDCIDNWSIYNGGDYDVEGEGMFNDEYQYICFPSDFLTKTDEELVSIVEVDEKERIRKREEKEEKRRMKEEEETRQKELAELKRLKEKYEKGD